MALHLIKKPVITEKSTAQNIKNKYMFEVKREASKGEIRQSIEALYGVKVTSIRTQIMPAKKRLVKRGRLLTKRPVMKRAIVTIEKGKNIDPNKIM